MMNFGKKNTRDPLVAAIEEFIPPEDPIFAELVENILLVQDNPSNTMQPCVALFNLNLMMPYMIINHFLERTQRPVDDKGNFLGYSPDLVKRLKQKTGVQLRKLARVPHDVYFSSELLGYRQQIVTPELIRELDA